MAVTTANKWQTEYVPSRVYYDINSYQITVTEEMLDAGFEHFYSGRAYKVQPRLAGADLIAKNIETIEKRIAKDEADLKGLKAAQKLLNDNPEWTTLLSLHKRGLF